MLGSGWVQLFKVQLNNNNWRRFPSSEGSDITQKTQIIKAGCIQSWKTWKSHGIPLFFHRPGKVMEIDSRLWKIYKKLWKFKGILSQNSVVPFFHPAFQYNDMLYNQIKFGVFHIFLYCYRNPVSCS